MGVVVKRLSMLLLLAVSCDPQADRSYLGEPLMTLHGQVISPGTLPQLEAAMLWQRGPPPSNDDQQLATRAPVQAGFPATFTAHLYQPPPGAARKTLLPGEVTYARANAAAVPAGIAANAIGPPAAGPAAGAGGPPPSGPPATSNYGIDPRHWVVWLETDVAPGSLMEWWLGGALSRGFHLLRVDAVNPACVALDPCLADLAARGVTDPAIARGFCLQPYRLSVAPPNEQLVLDLGAVGLGAAPGVPCP
jgi:hypothetical protein